MKLRKKFDENQITGKRNSNFLFFPSYNSQKIKENETNLMITEKLKGELNKFTGLLQQRFFQVSLKFQVVLPFPLLVFHDLCYFIEFLSLPFEVF